MKAFLKIIIASTFLIFATFSFADLQEIKQSGVIRVGVTGDYQPFSWYDEKTQQYSGLDIELAKDLAKHLGVKIQFIHTTWPTLTQDLQNNRFDIAMGGISISPEREKVFIFSKPYLFDNKVAVINCVNRMKWEEITALNHPEVRVIENKGGTNEKFAKENLKKANITLVEKNINIFQYLLTQKADVMITDDTEAIYQKKLYPQLCIIKFDPGISPLQGKAIMLQKNDIDLQQAINQWLNQMQKYGQLQKIFFN